MRFFSYIILVLCFVSCKTIFYNTISDYDNHNVSAYTSIIDIKITGFDLSEDVSRLSSKNDELVLLIYEDTVKPVLQLKEYFVFDTNNSTRTYQLIDSLSYNSVITVVLVELDTQKNLAEIEATVCKSISKLNSDKGETIISSLQKNLGDDDLLGIKRVFITKQGFNFRFKGVHIFDSYDYDFMIHCK